MQQNSLYRGLFTALPVENQRWNVIVSDLVGGLHITTGNNTYQWKKEQTSTEKQKKY
jgi:hypothetical protein